MANSLNKVQIIGNITRDLELRETKGGDAVCAVDIATNHPVKDGDKWKDVADFHTVILWGKLAETAAKYLGKGDKVYFEGRLQTRSWEADDGTKRYKTEIQAREMIMLGSRRKDELDEHDGYVKKQKDKQQSLDDTAADLEGKPRKQITESDVADDLPF